MEPGALNEDSEDNGDNDDDVGEVVFPSFGDEDDDDDERLQIATWRAADRPLKASLPLPGTLLQQLKIVLPKCRNEVAGYPGTPSPAAAARMERVYTWSSLDALDGEDGLELAATALALLREIDAGLATLAKLVVGYKGLAFALEAIAQGVSCGLILDHDSYPSRLVEGVVPYATVGKEGDIQASLAVNASRKAILALREIAAAAKEADYAACVNTAHRLLDSAASLNASIAIAVVLSEEEDIVKSVTERAIALGDDADAVEFLLLSLRDGELAKQLMAKTFVHLHDNDNESPAWTMIARMGPAAGSVLASAVKSTDDDHVIPYLEAIHTPASFRALLTFMPQKKMTKRLQKLLLAHPEITAKAIAPILASPKHKNHAAAKVIASSLAKTHPGLVPSSSSSSSKKSPSKKAAASALPAVLRSPPKAACTKLANKSPKLPAYIDASSLPPVLFRTNSAAIPPDAVEHILTMLSLSEPDDAHPSLSKVRDACTAKSLEEMSWALFEAWMASGSPPKDMWILHGLGFLGDDETVRKLVPMIRAWPGEHASARAVEALSVLSNIGARGSDLALMHLDGIAEKARFASIQEAARERIAAIAEKRGLTRDELSDRLVPDLGPNPSTKDLAALKKSRLQRFESAMIARRRWSMDDFESLILGKPIVRDLARSFVWTATDAKEKKTLFAFRIDTDGSLANDKDEAIKLPRSAKVGIVHPIDMKKSERDRWAEMFAEYEIVQPFPQLNREIYTFKAKKKNAKEIELDPELALPAPKLVFGLERRQWRRGRASDGGAFSNHSKSFNGTPFTAHVEYSGAVSMGFIEENETLTVEKVTITREKDHRPAAIDAIDPIIVSEVMRDLATLSS